MRTLCKRTSRCWKERLEVRLGRGWLVERLEVGVVVTFNLPIGGSVPETKPGGSSVTS